MLYIFRLIGPLHILIMPNPPIKQTETHPIHTIIFTKTLKWKHM